MGVNDVFDGIADKIESDLGNQPAPETRESTSTAPSNSEILELDKIEKFKFEGQEWSPKDLKNAYLRQQDYTRKTQDLARERDTVEGYKSEKRFVDNLFLDLKNVKDNPALADQFRKIYPEKFHTYLDFIEAKKDLQNGQPQQNPEYALLKKDLDEVKGHFQQQRVQAAEAQIDAVISKLAPQYKMADEETVIVRARVASEGGVKLTPDVWEKIYKDVHDKNMARYKDHYEQQIKEQQAVNSKGRDIGKGGGTPGSAPKKRTFDEATADAVRELSSRH